jgi:tripartite ATP-independent transporter DctM subunit
MEWSWYLMLILFFVGLFSLMLTGMPIAFCFLLINIVFMFLLWGGSKGLEQFVLSIFASLASFVWLPIPLFVLMGDVIFVAGVAPDMIGAVDKWLGRLPGRLSFLAVGGGTLLATLTSSSIASGIILARTLLPEMEKRGYKKPMSLGPILGSGGLAIMIPPSGMAVLIGALGDMSVGKLLIAIIIPGLLMATNYAILILVRCTLQPSLAPPYEVAPAPLSEKLVATARYILPIGFIIFLVTGVIFLGIATPSEAAATGALGCFILAAAYRRLNWEVVKKSISSTLEITVMILMIIGSSVAFSQILAFSGATQGVTEYILNLVLPPIGVVVAIMILGLILGMFMSTNAIIIIVVPLVMPIIVALGFDPVWFGVLFLIIMEVGVTSPPFGLTLFAIKGVAPNTSIKDCYKAALPWIGCDLIAVTLILFFPAIALWLPGMML